MAVVVLSFLKYCNSGELWVSAFNLQMYSAGPFKLCVKTDLQPSSYEDNHRRQEMDTVKFEYWTYQDDEAPGGYRKAAWERGGVIGHDPSNTK